MNPDKGPFLELVHEARINDLVKERMMSTLKPVEST